MTTDQQTTSPIGSESCNTMGVGRMRAGRGGTGESDRASSPMDWQDRLVLAACAAIALVNCGLIGIGVIA